MQVPSFNLRKFRAVQGVENWDLIYLTQRRREAESAEGIGETLLFLLFFVANKSKGDI